MPKCTPRLIYVEHTTWCAFKKVMNGNDAMAIFEYVVMPFGLTNGPDIFQHLMNNVFHEYFDDFMVSYINDMLIFLKNMEDHEHHVCLVL
jgi:hypothetical protein